MTGAGSDVSEPDQAKSPQDEPDSPGPMDKAEADARRMSTPKQPFGPLGPRLRRSPFTVGMGAAAGVAVTYALTRALVSCQEILILGGLAFFIAVGLEPLVVWLVRHGVPRLAAVFGVLAVATGVVTAFLALAIPPIVAQSTQFAKRIPHYVRAAEEPWSGVGRINTQFGLQQHLQQFLSGNGSALTEVLFGAGRALFSAVTGTVVVIVLVIYFVASMPRIRRGLYRLVPAPRRPRAILLGDEIFTKIGGYVLGNMIVSLIIAVATFVWLLLWGVPYSLLLAVLVALLDLVPVVGSVLGGIICSLVALTVSVPIALATAGFYVAYRLFEDYLLMPKIVGRVVRVPAVVTVVAVLVGGALLGVLGALVAIPLAAVVLLLLREITYPRMDRACEG